VRLRGNGAGGSTGTPNRELGLPKGLAFAGSGVGGGGPGRSRQRALYSYMHREVNQVRNRMSPVGRVNIYAFHCTT
jgi:hypothetical protein